jgi:hypothetical protein
VHLKVVGDGKTASGREFEEAVAEVAVAGEPVGIEFSVEGSVAVEEIDVAAAI